jgi:chromosome segregation ATPase
MDNHALAKKKNTINPNIIIGIFCFGLVLSIIYLYREISLSKEKINELEKNFKEVEKTYTELVGEFGKKLNKIESISRDISSIRTDLNNRDRMYKPEILITPTHTTHATHTQNKQKKPYINEDGDISGEDNDDDSLFEKLQNKLIKKSS